MEFAIRGGWFAPRGDAPIDSASAEVELKRMRKLGVTHVALGHDVSMPCFVEPKLEWGDQDDGLRRAIRHVRNAGMEVFLMPRIESPDFFKPPYPFRADIRFESEAEWDAFHGDVERMLLHYAEIALVEKVAILGIGLEMKHSVREHGAKWRQIIAKLRARLGDACALTYSANWYDEWKDVPFWDALDYVGVGAYFELDPGQGLGPDADPVADLSARWQAVVPDLKALAKRVGRPMLFTEVGYTGYVDCAEKPWHWAGKQEDGIAIDHARQADAYRALFETFASEEWLAGMFLWTFYAGDRDLEDWEYAIQGRPSEAAVRRAYVGHGDGK